ncbi:glycosyltransferase family 4 protein [Pedobacter agri]|uniref:glycosyltransferase family 4 protein n=1 Tax=Pedobacter agri TaxID=454586 RepID=UPI00292E588D|nr:glycosyltransferase family 4 protein [Pedobacter agri]
MKKLAIVVTHPIQYYAPVFKLLATACALKVFYTLGSYTKNEMYDDGFKQIIKWDIDLLDGYEFEFLENKARRQGFHHFMGVKNPDIIQSIMSFDPDAILVYGWAYQSHLKVLRHFKGNVPIWFRGDSHLLDPKPLWKTLTQKALLTWVYSHIDKAFYVGTANKAYFKSFGINKDQLIFAPHAVDNERFSVDRSAEAGLTRENLGVGLNETLILFAGKLEKKKGPDVLLQAFLDLKMKDVHLLFVGNGELEESLKRKAESLALKAESLKSNVHFMDFQNQSYMPVVYQACDLFCLPSSGPNETWGLAVNEAMAAGKAILVSDKVGCSKDLIHVSNGYIFMSSNLTSLQQNLRQIIGGDLKDMGQSSKQIISKWDFKQQVNKVIRELNHE